MTLNLARQLALAGGSGGGGGGGGGGGHYYDIPALREQVRQAPRPLLGNMARFPLDEVRPIPDREPRVTARLRQILRDLSAGTVRAEHYTPEFLKDVTAAHGQIAADM